jgi:hypothetical protein
MEANLSQPRTLGTLLQRPDKVALILALLAYDTCPQYKRGTTDQSVDSPIIGDSASHQIRGIPSHLWQLLDNLRVRLSSFLRSFIGHLLRREEPQYRKRCSEAAHPRVPFRQ